MSHIPIIDVSELNCADPTRARAVRGQLAKVCHEIGFVGIQGHTIPSSLLDTLRAQVIALFDLPEQRKLELRVQPHNYRGYIPLGFFTPNAAKQKADLYEGYKLHAEVDSDDPICAECDLCGPNLWPEELPLLRQTVLEYWRYCDDLSALLLSALAAHLGLPIYSFEQAFDKPLSNMTLLHYPPGDPEISVFGIHPHKDTDALTILVPDANGGLWLRPRGSKKWIEAKVPPRTLLVNVGDMLETWSAGYYQSTPHKVVNLSGKERYSFPYFSVPRYDVAIQPLISTKQDKSVVGDSAGDISRKIWHSNWPDALPVEKQYDPYTE